MLLDDAKPILAHTKNLDMKMIFMNFVFLDVLAMGFFTGYWCYCRNPLFSGIVGAIVSAVSLFAGSVLAFMYCDRRMISKQKQIVMELEKSFGDRIKEAIRGDRLIYGAMSVEMSKVVANRVANRIAGKHIDGMSIDSTRKSVLDSINRIINEEIGMLYDAVKTESKS